MTYIIELTPDQLAVIGAALNELPRKLAQPVFAAIEPQVNAQNEAAEKRAEPPCEGEDCRGKRKGK